MSNQAGIEGTGTYGQLVWCKYLQRTKVVTVYEVIRPRPLRAADLRGQIQDQLMQKNAARFRF